ncbi:hypothetical protein ZIOFF_037501 [Zingiber officinale]|uniref:Uncharacterized protein n=1 Tax=Zingiber officinale TaxID=94328 RepID=A0A8J5L9A3_ZINOF|nr:hypothetical protein ZIOFF_037501 [Zingiber officinale]
MLDAPNLSSKISPTTTDGDECCQLRVTTATLPVQAQLLGEFSSIYPSAASLLLSPEPVARARVPYDIPVPSPPSAIFEEFLLEWGISEEASASHSTLLRVFQWLFLFSDSSDWARLEWFARIKELELLISVIVFLMVSCYFREVIYVKPPVARDLIVNLQLRMRSCSLRSSTVRCRLLMYSHRCCSTRLIDPHYHFWLQPLAPANVDDHAAAPTQRSTSIAIRRCNSWLLRISDARFGITVCFTTTIICRCFFSAYSAPVSS